MRSVIKRFGGKAYLARSFITLFPAHTTYVEPFFGSGAVLFAKDPEGVSEIVNDLDGDLSLFWMALRCEVAFPRLCRLIQACPVSEGEWRLAARMLAVEAPPPEDDFWRRRPESLADRAFWFFVHARQSLGGRQQSFAPMSVTRTRRGMNEQVAAWLGAAERLPEVHARLRRVVILCRDAVRVVEQHDSPDTLTFCDPPYPHRTRQAKSAYRHEMTDDDHRRLLDAARQCKGKVALCSYPNQLYDESLSSWNRHDFVVANHSSHSKVKDLETEALYCNY